MTSIDLNCDVGEGVGLEADILPLVSSANIACGAHAGNATSMAATMRLVTELGLARGAHPGFEDREHFGRRELNLSAQELRRLVISQLETLARFGAFTYVKPHGALYNLAARDEAVAFEVARAVKTFDPGLGLLGLAGSCLIRAGEREGLFTAAEAFADRRYDEHGRLVNRQEVDALIASSEESVEQVLELVVRQRVRSLAGSWVRVEAQSICLHGDNPSAVAFARHLRTALHKAEVQIKPLWGAV